MNDPDKNQLADSEWTKSVRKTLDDSAAQVDGHVRDRLLQARREAVREASVRQSHRRRGNRWLVPAGGFAALLMAVIVSFVISTGPSDNPSTIDQSAIASTEDFPLLTSPESLELYEELDFYQWLEEEKDRVG